MRNLHTTHAGCLWDTVGDSIGFKLKCHEAAGDGLVSAEISHGVHIVKSLNFEPLLIFELLPVFCFCFFRKNGNVT